MEILFFFTYYITVDIRQGINCKPAAGFDQISR